MRKSHLVKHSSFRPRNCKIPLRDLWFPWERDLWCAWERDLRFARKSFHVRSILVHWHLDITVKM